MNHTIVALVQDRPGVLNRAISLFRRRGYNIVSLAVGPCEIAGASRMTIVVDARDAEQVVRQFNRLIEVMMVRDITSQFTVERETALLKIDARSADVASVLSLAHASGARVLDVSGGAAVLEITDAPARVENFIDQLRPFGIRELMRTGRVAMTRGVGAPRRAPVTAPHAIPEPLPFHVQADGATDAGHA